VYEIRQDKNEHIKKELYAFSIISHIEKNRETWRDNFERVTEGRFPKEALRYQSKGRKDPRQPRRRWLEKPEQPVA
jgi:hypothetical protein